MAFYRAFEHVLRLETSKMDVPKFLQGTVYVMPKIDGTNFSAWADEQGNIHCGSRHREVCLEKDNASSMLFFTTEPMFEKLRQWLRDNPRYIVYGEFIGGLAGRALCGTIKQYVQKGMLVFAVYDVEDQCYLPHPIYSELLDGVYDQVIEPLAVLENPTMAQINSYVENHYNLPDDVLGEGIVLWNYDYKNAYGKFEIGKIVNAEARSNKGRVKTKNLPIDNVEKMIVDSYVTAADCEKAKQKTCVKFDLEEWVVDRRTMGFYLNMLFNDLVEEEMGSIVKKFKLPTIQFGLLRKLTFEKGREYLGLV